MVIASERYLAVCRPLTYRALTVARSSRVRLALYLVPVIILSVAVNIPRFFETVIVPGYPYHEHRYEKKSSG